MCENLETTTTTTVTRTSAIRRDRSDILNTANFDTSTSQSTKGTLGTRSWGLRLGTTCGTEFDVNSGDIQFFQSRNNVLSSHHGGIRRRFITIGLDFHSTTH